MTNLIWVQFDTGRHPEISSVRVDEASPFGETIRDLKRLTDMEDCYILAIEKGRKDARCIRTNEGIVDFRKFTVVTIYTPHYDHRKCARAL